MLVPTSETRETSMGSAFGSKTAGRYIIWVALLAWLILSGSPASAATVSWLTAGGGNWNVATNWSGGAVPATNDDVLITLAGTYTVTLNANASIKSLTLGGST